MEEEQQGSVAAVFELELVFEEWLLKLGKCPMFHQGTDMMKPLII